MCKTNFELNLTFDNPVQNDLILFPSEPLTKAIFYNFFIRACGRVLCGQCSDNRAPLRYNQFQAARVCDDCYSSLFTELGTDEDLVNKFKPRNSTKPPKKISISKDESQNSGFLSLRLRNGRWKKSWYTLNHGILYSFAGKEDTNPADEFDLKEYPLIAGNGLVTFILRSENIYEVEENEEREVKELHFTTDTHTARDGWVKAILASNHARLTDNFEF